MQQLGHTWQEYDSYTNRQGSRRSIEIRSNELAIVKGARISKMVQIHQRITMVVGHTATELLVWHSHTHTLHRPSMWV